MVLLVRQCKLVHGHAYLTILSICLPSPRSLSALYSTSSPPPSSSFGQSRYAQLRSCPRFVTTDASARPHPAHVNLSSARTPSRCALAPELSNAALLAAARPSSASIARRCTSWCCALGEDLPSSLTSSLGPAPSSARPGNRTSWRRTASALRFRADCGLPGASTLLSRALAAAAASAAALGAFIFASRLPCGAPPAAVHSPVTSSVTFRPHFTISKFLKRAFLQKRSCILSLAPPCRYINVLCVHCTYTLRPN